MNDTNPYAPPTTTETGSPSGAFWQCYGERVMARNGAMLPKVDLETGVSEGAMTAVPRNYQAAGAGQFVRIMVFIGIYAMGRKFLHIEGMWLLPASVASSTMLRWFIRTGNGSGAIVIWEFREAARERKRRLRRKLRFGLLFLGVAVIGVGAVLSDGDDSLVSKSLFAGLGLLIIQSIWAFLDRPKTRSESAPGGWLRIRNVHPEAMVKLRRIEAAELAKISPFRRRRVFTTYYHKYPLPCLLGTKKNPLTILLIALVKFLPSKRLERESYDFTEAHQIREDEAHEKLQERIQSWRAAHPDWTVIDVERLPSPAGDLMLETAILASPDLAHLLLFPPLLA
ncbi:MAG: hypothetical protein ABI162_19605 [Luteolibacter sp.]